jgi:hypothetical protein
VRDYFGTYRRMLLDMHVPDWEPSFLSNYDPSALADAYVRANVTAVMLYCNSHVGLTMYPAPTGRMHAGLRGRDVVGELNDALHERGIAACAYYSVLFDNWAVAEHPDWWISPLGAGGGGGAAPRYGVCCPNKRGYVDFTIERIRDLLPRYDFDCLFYDMTFWAAVCGCADCRERYGSELPETVDWTAPAWCDFQAARERWLREFVRRIVGAAKDVRPDLPVYNNFALAVAGWEPAFALSLAGEVDFCGGDMYGDATEQLVVSKLMANLTGRRPAEFMTSLCVNLRDHVRLRSAGDLRTKAWAALAHGSATLFIDAVDPNGAIDPARYDVVGEVFAGTSAYEPFLGGDPVEDVAVYHSSESRMSFAEDGRPVGGVTDLDGRTPHQRAVRGACRALQRAHVPFGVITRKQLDALDRYAVVILPEVLRMDDEEVEAFRSYAARGGRLYASGKTSLTHTRGERRGDFMLADVFGVSSDGEEAGPALYVRDAESGRYSSVMPPMRGMNVAPGGVRIPAVRLVRGEVLATLTLPYGYPAVGTVFDRNWSSIHAWPPHEDTDRPVVVAGGGCVYSSVVLETTDGELFVRLVRRLLGGRERFSAHAHPAVWMTAFDQPDRMVACFVNYAADPPAVPMTDVRFTLRPAVPVSGVWLAPGGAALAHERRPDASIEAILPRLEEFAMVVAGPTRREA